MQAPAEKPLQTTPNSSQQELREVVPAAQAIVSPPIFQSKRGKNYNYQTASYN